LELDRAIDQLTGFFQARQAASNGWQVLDEGEDLLGLLAHQDSGPLAVDPFHPRMTALRARFFRLRRKPQPLHCLCCCPISAALAISASSGGAIWLRG